jgi:hypothetical protein
MNCVLIRFESSLKGLGPNAVELAKTFTDQAMEGRERTFVGTTLDKHVDQFNLQCSVSKRQSHAHKNTIPLHPPLSELSAT